MYVDVWVKTDCRQPYRRQPDGLTLSVNAVYNVANGPRDPPRSNRVSIVYQQWLEWISEGE